MYTDWGGPTETRNLPQRVVVAKDIQHATDVARQKAHADKAMGHQTKASNLARGYGWGPEPLQQTAATTTRSHRGEPQVAQCKD